MIGHEAWHIIYLKYYMTYNKAYYLTRSPAKDDEVVLTSDCVFGSDRCWDCVVTLTALFRQTGLEPEQERIQGWTGHMMTYDKMGWTWHKSMMRMSGRVCISHGALRNPNLLTGSPPLPSIQSYTSFFFFHINHHIVILLLPPPPHHHKKSNLARQVSLQNSTHSQERKCLSLAWIGFRQS